MCGFSVIQEHTRKCKCGCSFVRGERPIAKKVEESWNDEAKVFLAIYYLAYVGKINGGCYFWLHT
jgi:hypothetical protein